MLWTSESLSGACNIITSFDIKPDLTLRDYDNRQAKLRRYNSISDIPAGTKGFYSDLCIGWYTVELYSNLYQLRNVGINVESCGFIHTNEEEFFADVVDKNNRTVKLIIPSGVIHVPVYLCDTNFILRDTKIQLMRGLHDAMNDTDDLHSTLCLVGKSKKSDDLKNEIRRINKSLRELVETIN